jgi:hypothetical protein
MNTALLQSHSKPKLGYGSVRENPNRIYQALYACCESQTKIKGLDAMSCERRGELAVEAANIYANEIRGCGTALDASGSLVPTIKSEFLMAKISDAFPLEAASDIDTLGTLAGTIVSQRYLDIFMYKLPMLARVLTDFSDSPSALNQVENTRKVLIPSVSSFDGTLDTDGFPKGWSPASAATTVDVNITLDELIGVPIPFSLAALSSTPRQLFMEQAPAAAYAAAKYYAQKIYGVCTAGNFNAYTAVTAADSQGIVKVPTAYATYAVSVIDFSRNSISEIATAFDSNEVPDEDRSLLLNAPYYNKATTDPSITTFFAGQQAPEIVTQGVLPSLAGFVPIKAPNFPGSNNRVGIALQRNGLIAKSRLPNNLNTANPDGGNGFISQIIHPDSGMAMMLVQWVDHKRGYASSMPCAILGAAKGDARGGLVITSQ